MIKNKIGQILVHIILWVFVILSIIPFLSMISTSFSKAMYELPYPPRLLPESLDFSNYITVIRDDNFFRYMLNSLILSVLVTFFVLVVSSLSAYGFAKFEFPGKEIIFTIYLFTMMVPGVLNLVAQYAVLNSIHLVNTYLGVLLLMIGGGVAGNTFFLEAFLKVFLTNLRNQS